MSIKRDYRNYPKPRMWSIEILLYLDEGKPRATSLDISHFFKITTSEATARFTTLRRYGLVKRISSKPYMYEISRWGEKYLNDNRNKILEKIRRKSDKSN